jgi:hypothetical protein
MDMFLTFGASITSAAIPAYEKSIHVYGSHFASSSSISAVFKDGGKSYTNILIGTPLVVLKQ